MNDTFGYNPTIKTRWSFPILHIFHDGDDQSSCKQISREDAEFVFSDRPPRIAFTLCDYCCGVDKIKLKTELYGG